MPRQRGRLHRAVAASSGRAAALTVRAVFGTTITTSVPGGGGTVALWPPQGLYPYGSLVRMTGQPLADKYLSRWINVISGPTMNPLDYRVLSNTPIVNAFFANLTPGNFTLTTTPFGAGTINRNPANPFYAPNAGVQVTAVPDPGWAFLNWSGSTTSPGVIDS